LPLTQVPLILPRNVVSIFFLHLPHFINFKFSKSLFLKAFVIKHSLHASNT